MQRQQLEFLNNTKKASMKGHDIHMMFVNLHQHQLVSKNSQSMYEGMRYPCDVCEFVATSAYNLKTHKES